jgi:subtilase family serine protease
VDNATLSNVPFRGELGPQAEVTMVSRAWNATLGTHDVQAKADVFGSIPEQSEANNRGGRSVVVGRADLVVQDVFTTDISPTPGDPTSFSAVVVNVGPSTAPATKVLFRLDGMDHSLRDAPVLRPGEGWQIYSAAWNPTPGNHTLMARADATGLVPEVSEANNTRTESFQV